MAELKRGELKGRPTGKEVRPRRIRRIDVLEPLAKRPWAAKVTQNE
jgi:hypothetical protein